ncbi:MAG TPA: anti-sigma factor [Solirubrobacteraceae bacterium]|nr:anti-sigma factor [Solirubrobacteraceae bacterium]
MTGSDDMRCPQSDNVAPFVLGALEHDAIDPFVEHLGTCASCRAEYDELQATATMLPLAVEQRDPPPEMKQRLMAVVRSEAELLRAAGPDADRVTVKPEGRRWWARLTERPLATALSGAGAAAAVVLVVVALAGGGSDTRTIQAQVLIPKANAQVEVNGGSGTLVASGMPSPSGGHVYAIWTQRANEKPRFAGTLGATPSKGSARATLNLDGVRQVMVSVEPADVGSAPTTEPVVTAQLT